MAFYLDFPNTALEDAAEALEWMTQHSPKNAPDWYNGLIEAVFSLEEMPRRCALAPESNDYDKEVRQLLYTKRRVTYRIIFVILPGDEDFEGIVRVCRIRHSSQKPLTPDDIRQGEED